MATTPGEAHLLRNRPGGLNNQFYDRRHGNEGDKKAGITPLCQCLLQLSSMSSSEYLAVSSAVGRED
jgi:hypothetical protein